MSDCFPLNKTAEECGLKIGDKIIVRDSMITETSARPGMILTIKRIPANSSYKVRVDACEGSDPFIYSPLLCGCAPFNELGVTKKFNSSDKTFMSNVKEFFRNMTASADEKLLKEFGVEDPIGTPTTLGLELSAEITYKKNREEIIEIVKKMKAESDDE